MTPQFNDDSDYEAAWAEESWTAHGGTPPDWEPHIYIDVCQFVDGVHVYAGYYCSHLDDNSEDGEIPTGWTVQNS